MQIDPRDGHFAKALGPIRVSFESLSKVRIERFVQEQKALSQIVSTVAGMQIDESDEQFSKADSPICESFEPR
jgi:hypothetical protein